MDNTRASLRRARAWLFVLVGCVVYAALPMSEREIARDRVRHATGVAIEWTAQHFKRMDP